MIKFYRVTPFLQIPIKSKFGLIDLSERIALHNAISLLVVFPKGKEFACVQAVFRTFQVDKVIQTDIFDILFYRTRRLYFLI